LGARKGDRFLVGFAAETGDLVERARAKLREKHLDLVVANEVATGFGGDTSAAVLLPRQGEPVDVPLTSKRELADRLWDAVVRLRARAGEPAVAGAAES
jgi:phosphopantothenoylcysteine decarboxylase/phosphopantothenate--cysteine ligase